MEKSFPFNSVNGDRAYDATDIARYFSVFLSDGVSPLPGNSLQIATDATPSMKVTVKKGNANIKGQFYMLLQDKQLQIDVANPTADRIDTIVLRVDYTQRAIDTIVKKGTTELIRNSDFYELGLANITVRKGAAEIGVSDIVDLRLENKSCGIMQSLMSVDTTTLFNQYKAFLDEKLKGQEFQQWLMQLRGYLDKDSALKLKIEIDRNKDLIDEIKRATSKKYYNRDLYGNPRTVIYQRANGSRCYDSQINGQDPPNERIEKFYDIDGITVIKQIKYKLLWTNKGEFEGEDIVEVIGNV